MTIIIIITYQVYSIARYYAKIFTLNFALIHQLMSLLLSYTLFPFKNILLSLKNNDLLHIHKMTFFMKKLFSKIIMGRVAVIYVLGSILDIQLSRRWLDSIED